MKNSEKVIINIFIPVYNAEKYLNQCLDSIINQSIFDKLSIVIINDGSTDNSQKIIDEYTSKYSNIFGYVQENKGLPYARTAGLCKFLNGEVPRGKYFYTADSDDFLENDMLEILLKVAEQEESDLTYCDYSFYPHKISTKAKWFKHYQGVLDWKFIERNTQPWNKLVRWDLAKSIKLQDIWPIYGDSVYLDLLIHAKHIACVNRSLYHYRVGHASMSGSYKGKLKFYLYVAEIAYMQRNFIKGLENKSLETYFNYRYIYALLQACFISALDENKPIYDEIVIKLKTMDYLKNPLTMMILNHNFGKLKAFALGYLIPANYYLARAICKVALR